MKSKGKSHQKIEYRDKDGLKINSGKITTFSYLSLFSENRVTKIRSDYKNQIEYLPNGLLHTCCIVNIGKNLEGRK